MQELMMSCPVKGVMSAGGGMYFDEDRSAVLIIGRPKKGFALGGIFGMFISSMEFSNYSQATVVGKDGVEKVITDLPMRQQVREAFRDMGKRSYSMAKSFGVVGAVFATTECVIEGVRFGSPRAVSSSYLLSLVVVSLLLSCDPTPAPALAVE